MKEKRGNMFNEMIRGIVLILFTVLIAGCSDTDELEQKNIQLQAELTRSKASNTQLVIKIKKLEQKNIVLKKELSSLKNKNKNLGASLVQNEQLKAERKKLQNELEALNQEKQRIKKEASEATEAAETNIKNKYILILEVLSIIITILIILFIFKIRGKNKEIENIINTNKKSEAEAADQITIKVDSKRVKLYNSKGALKKNINIDEDIVSAIQKGDEIHILTVTEKIKIYSLAGSLKKIIDANSNTEYPNTSELDVQSKN